MAQLFAAQRGVTAAHPPMAPSFGSETFVAAVSTIPQIQPVPKAIVTTAGTRTYAKASAPLALQPCAAADSRSVVRTTAADTAEATVRALS